MAKTFKLNVSFPVTIVVPSDTEKDFSESREIARKIITENTKPLRGETKFRIELMASDKSDEEVLQTIFRAGIREFLRTDFAKEIGGTESNVRVGDTRVTFEARDVLARSCDCNACYECKIANGGRDE